MNTQQIVTGLIAFAGGIGLFLLGMRLMTDGLKVAAGPALRSLLAAATRSPLRGLGSGVLITAVVQSSSAVIFATIGFVNAGLLTLAQAVSVILGSNLGTTLTSWIVALIGFNVDLQALAMPAIALGMGLWVLGGVSRRGALGQALAGFGIFFLGIDFLKDSFADVGELLDVMAVAGGGMAGLLLFTLIGIVLTILMQSSSAALAVTLTAAAGGLMPLNAAAAMVIGANVGTTSTAVFAVLGATPAARRAAAAHVVFNVITAVVAFLILPLLLAGVLWVAEWLGAARQPATVLAIFHTSTKLLGLCLLWPFTGRMVSALEKRFRAAAEDDARPQYLDRNVLATPTLAIDAVRMETARMGRLAHRMANAAINSERPEVNLLAAEERALETLGDAITEFAGAVHAGEQDADLSTGLADAVRVTQYYRNVGARAADLATLLPEADGVEAAADVLDQVRQAAIRALTAVGPDVPGTAENTQQEFEAAYQAAKTRILKAGTVGQLSARRMVQVLDYASTLRRMVDQATKARHYLPQQLAVGGEAR